MDGDSGARLWLLFATCVGVTMPLKSTRLPNKDRKLCHAARYASITGPKKCLIMVMNSWIGKSTLSSWYQKLANISWNTFKTTWTFRMDPTWGEVYPRHDMWVREVKVDHTHHQLLLPDMLLPTSTSLPCPLPSLALRWCLWMKNDGRRAKKGIQST